MKKIVIDGTEYPCFQTMGAVLYYKDETGEEVSAIKAGEISKLVIFFWCTVKAACDRCKVEFPYTAREFAVMVDSSQLDQWQNSAMEESSGTQEKGEKKSPRRSRTS